MVSSLVIQAEIRGRRAGWRAETPQLPIGNPVQVPAMELADELPFHGSNHILHGRIGREVMLLPPVLLHIEELDDIAAGIVNELVPEVKSRGFKKALIVTDADLVKFKVVKKVTDILDKNKMSYEIFDKVKANPSVEIVQEGVKAFKKAKADYMIAIGGGSPQDTAKGIGIIINNPEFADVVSLEGVAPTKNKSVPVIAIATTAGTAA